MEGYPLALVTGAAYRLGRVFALTLARQGYAILLHYYHSIEVVESTLDEIRSIGVPAFPVKADLTDILQIQSLFTAIDSIGFPLKVLINSAAEMRRADLGSMTVEDWDATINLNLRAVVFVAKNAAERMSDGGLIVNISDAGSGMAWTGFPAYSVSKAGLDSLTRIQAKTYAPKIRVNAIAPGLALPAADVSPEEWARLIDRLPLNHPVEMEELADTLKFLLSNESITGQTIVVDGGYSLI